MILRVYQNLRRHDWSLLDPKTNRVIGHRTELVLLDVTLIVSEKTRQRVIRDNRRTVHAYAAGVLSEESPRAGGLKLHYNPFLSGDFTCDGRVVTYADRVDFHADGAFLYAS